MSQLDQWEVIIGLEIHAQLNTKSKLFSRAPNRFGDEPNTNITNVCTGQPGTLPVLNKEAVKKAVQFGCAIGADIQKFSKFDRKSYFYPDSPRNFQITQFDQPILIGGLVKTEVNGQEMSFEVDRVHLEDDAGMLKHFPNYAGVDYNRAGVPLIEVVSKPCIHTPRQAACYAMAVRAILLYIDVSNCNMQEGSLRFDANVSVRKKGESGFRNKIEIKNMNSFSFMEMALESEIKRQIKAYLSNPEKPPEQVIIPSTYRWDPDNKKTVLMRKKESSDDYRYFPEPDLVPIILTDAYIEDIRSAMPELPMERERRYIHDLKLSPGSAFSLVSDKPLADYFEKALKTCSNARNLCNWLVVEFPGRFKDSELNLINSGITPEHLSKLINMIDDGTITGKIAKSVADDMVSDPRKDPERIVKDNPDYQPLSDTSELEGMIDTILSENSQSVEDYKNGHNKAFAFLVGQVMKQTRGKANPKIVNEMLKEKIES